MKLLDLCPFETWKTFEEEIWERSGLNASVFDIQGIRIIPPMKWPNRLCPEIKADPKGQSFICATAHMNLAIQARDCREPVIAECDAGMLKLVVPIYVEDEFVGAVSGCGLLLDDGEADTFLVNKITGMPEERVEELAVGTEALSMEEAQTLCVFIQERVEAFVAAYRVKTKN
ncbi:MAG: PocR ligand-binding domain-containing protein [Desulfobacteraceae bacterium]|jgi:ligand-binding sensor protein